MNVDNVWVISRDISLDDIRRNLEMMGDYRKYYTGKNQGEIAKLLATCGLAVYDLHNEKMPQEERVKHAKHVKRTTGISIIIGG